MISRTDGGNTYYMGASAASNNSLLTTTSLTSDNIENYLWIVTEEKSGSGYFATTNTYLQSVARNNNTVTQESSYLYLNRSGKTSSYKYNVAFSDEDQTIKITPVTGGYTISNSNCQIGFSSSKYAGVKTGATLTITPITYKNAHALVGPTNITANNVLGYDAEPIEISFSLNLKIQDGYFSKEDDEPITISGMTSSNIDDSNAATLRDTYHINPVVTLKNGTYMSVSSTLGTNGNYFVATISPVGGNLMKSSTITDDITDVMNISATYTTAGGKDYTATGKANITRKVFEQKSVDKLIMTASPDDCNFDVSGNTENTIVVTFTHESGTAIYDLAGTMVDGTASITTRTLAASDIDPTGFSFTLTDYDTKKTVNWYATDYP
ncbi:MAG: hypothetical protein MJ231_07685, partial [bacterium]|nr:hypothetical protein [bacterium]